jgi:protein disulfide-isomerase
MRLFSLSWSLFLGAAALVNAAGEDDSTEDLTRENTYFDAKKVPPILELTPDNFEKEVKSSKYLLVKHYRYAPDPP